LTRIEGYAFEGCSSLTTLTIPNSVIQIGNYAFKGCSSLTSISIPKSVISIGNSAFYECSSLASIIVENGNSNYQSMNDILFNMDGTKLIKYPPSKTETSYEIPDSVTEIEKYAFYGCTSLNSVTITNSVNYIGDSAFSSCSSLTTITIPDSIINIGSDAFKGCSSLTSIIVDKENLNYLSNNDVLFNNDETELIKYPSGNTQTSYIIPNSVTKIGNGAFSDCRSLTSITIPDSVTYIGSNAFSGCSSLTSISIPDSIINIGNNVFSDCTSLENVTFDGKKEPSSVGSNIFSNTKVTKVNVPNNYYQEYILRNSCRKIKRSK